MKKRRSITNALYGTVIAVVLLGGISLSVAEAVHTQDYTIKVTDKTVKVHDKSSKYLNFSEIDRLGGKETRVFEDTDTLFRLKYDSSDLYAQMQVGHTYHVHTAGFRVPFFSMYENIITAQEVK